MAAILPNAVPESGLLRRAQPLTIASYWTITSYWTIEQTGRVNFHDVMFHDVMPAVAEAIYCHLAPGPPLQRARLGSVGPPAGSRNNI